MKINKINKYLKSIDNNNFILLFHNDILSLIINKNLFLIYTTAEQLEKKTIKEYINNFNNFNIYYCNDITFIFNNIYLK